MILTSCISNCTIDYYINILIIKIQRAKHTKNSDHREGTIVEDIESLLIDGILI